MTKHCQWSLFWTSLLQDGDRIVCKLQKSLYGIRQAPRFWYHSLSSVMGGNGFGISCSYIRFYAQTRKMAIFVSWWLACVRQEKRERSIHQPVPGDIFTTSDMVESEEFLCVHQTEPEIDLSHDSYIENFLDRFRRTFCTGGHTQTDLWALPRLGNGIAATKVAKRAIADRPFHELVGPLLCLSSTTRSDGSVAAGAVTLQVAVPRESLLNTRTNLYSTTSEMWRSLPPVACRCWLRCNNQAQNHLWDLHHARGRKYDYTAVSTTVLFFPVDS